MSRTVSAKLSAGAGAGIGSSPPVERVRAAAGPPVPKRTSAIARILDVPVVAVICAYLLPGTESKAGADAIRE
jgi:hypothetical protein